MRDYLDGLDWDKTPPPPPLPAEVVDAPAARYIEAYERITGRSLRRLARRNHLTSLVELDESGPWFDQSGHRLRFDWGAGGLTRLAPASDVVVIVDVLRFTTCLDVAVGCGAVVYPYRGAIPRRRPSPRRTTPSSRAAGRPGDAVVSLAD